MRRVVTRVVLGVLALAVLVVGGLFVYARFLAPDPPPELGLPGASSPVTPVPGGPTPGPSLGDRPAPGPELDGRWVVGPGSQAGYRVDEVLSGQHVTVVGRTEEVTGHAEVSEGSLVAAEVAVDVASVVTGTAARDSFYRDVLDVARFPEASFRLTEPLPLGGLSQRPATGHVRGVVTVHGVEQEVVAEVEVLLAGDEVQVVGAVPVVFEDFGITPPDLGFVAVDSAGVLELLLALTR